MALTGEAGKGGVMRGDLQGMQGSCEERGGIRSAP